jgi:hypothetical protein
MKTLLTLAVLAQCLPAFADSAAGWKCTSATVELKSNTPYMGENSKWAQTLFTLKRIDTPEPELNNVDTAYFLDINHDVGKFGVIYIDGKNEVGGKFSLVTAPLEDIGDGTIIRYKTTGTLTYSQGPTLKGKQKVECLFE